MACWKPPVRVSVFPHLLDNRAIDPLQALKSCWESLAGSTVRSGQARRNEGTPQGSGLRPEAGQCAPAERRNHQTGSPSRWGAGSEKVVRALSGGALMSLTPLSIPTPTPGRWHGQGGCGPRSIKSPEQNPCESSYPDVSTKRHWESPP